MVILSLEQLLYGHHAWSYWQQLAIWLKQAMQVYFKFWWIFPWRPLLNAYTHGSNFQSIHRCLSQFAPIQDPKHPELGQASSILYPAHVQWEEHHRVKEYQTYMENFGPKLKGKRNDSRFYGELG